MEDKDVLPIDQVVEACVKMEVGDTLIFSPGINIRAVEIISARIYQRRSKGVVSFSSGDGDTLVAHCSGF